MTIADILRSLSRFRRLANIVALLTLAIGVFFAVSPLDRYHATSTVLVQPKITAEGQPVSVQVVDFIVPSFIRTVDTRALQDRAGEGLSREVRAADVNVTAESESGTGIMTITVSSTTREAVAPWSQAIAERLVETADDQLVGLTIIDDAVEPGAPFAPNRPLIIAIAVVLAIVNALLAAIIAAAVKGRADRVTEIRERFGALVLGEIPRVRGSIADLGPAELMGGTGNAALADALQTLRANVSIALVARPNPWLVVTSAVPGEGKSTVSLSLGWLFASIQRPTILVDGDSRRPTAHRRLRLSLANGLESIVARGPAAILQPTDNRFLRFLGAGHPDRHPAEIASTNLPHLLEYAEETGEVVVIDAPPLPSAAEAIVYASACQNVLIVIDARRRDLTNVERMVTTLKDRDVHILGVVINRSRRKVRNDYYAHTTTPTASNPAPVAAPTPAALEPEVAVDSQPAPTGEREDAPRSVRFEPRPEPEVADPETVEWAELDRLTAPERRQNVVDLRWTTSAPSGSSTSPRRDE